MTRRIVAIVQARLGSTRLPGKVLLPLGTQPVLWHVVQRLRQTRLVDEVVVATTTNPNDDAVVAAAASWGVRCVRGSETDLLERHYLAAVVAGASIVVRIPSDKPLVDPRTVDEVVTAHLEDEADYTSNMPTGWPERTNVPFGLEVEVVSFPALQRAQELAAHTEREHGFAYVYQHPEAFKVRHVQAKQPFGLTRARFSLDTAEDYEFLQHIYSTLGPKSTELLAVEDVVMYLDSHSEVMQLNANVRQRGLQ